MNVEVEFPTESRLRNGFATVALHVPELGAREVLDLDFDALRPEVVPPDPLALDLLLVAAITYVVDRSIPRRIADDAWTRQISVEFPVAAPVHWQPARETLATALAFLTGDEWDIGFSSRPEELFTPPRQRRIPRRPPEAQVVSLFSGGLDSLAGVIDVLASSEQQMLLVGHHDDPGPAADQRRLHARLGAIVQYSGRTERLAVRVRPLPRSKAQDGQQVDPAGRERTLRSRSFLFLALGIYAAQMLGAQTRLLVPENGFIAVNIPLTPSRIGASSTRTTHPFFLNSIRSVAMTVGLDHPIINPFELSTKGEVLSNCVDAATLAQLAPESVSCAHSSRRGSWLRRTARHCGYCVPCLIRRAALHCVGQDDGDAYGLDVCAGELALDRAVADDLRAVLECLFQVQRHESVEERVAMAGPLPSGSFIDTVAMVGRGLDELRGLISDKGTRELQEWAGLR